MVQVTQKRSLLFDGVAQLPLWQQCVETPGWRFEMVGLDGRIDKLMATRLPGAIARQCGHSTIATAD
ncbi:hypothetical protein [Mesorhizobium carmichaelinearum]|uniref:hypothetical protein n=1 Tax=Mesorhizobium carmichaelinearum TaxID=1208188 RepID=UPI000BA4A178|nr:hypothetical protein [Mesorhizobium carmichaelinearum]